MSEIGGDFVAALRSYRDAYARNPKDVEAVRGIAQCAMALGRPELAFEYYVKLLILDNADPWGYLGRAQVMFQYAQPDRAMSDLARVLELDRPATEIRIDCAALLNDYGYPEMARDALRPLYDLHRDDDDFVCEWLFAGIVLGGDADAQIAAMLADVTSRWAGDPFVALRH